MNEKKIIVALLFLTAVAMVSGCFFEIYMQGTGKDQLMDLLSIHFSAEKGSNFSSVFITSFSSIMKIWLFLFLFPVIPILALLSPFICIFRGLSVGFSSTMLIETFGPKGALYIVSTIMPQSIIQLPVFCILCTYTLKMSIIITNYYLKRISRKRNKNVLHTTARHYIKVYLLSLAILIISCLIEAFLKQVLL